jgi:hypothetical protein
MNTNVVACCLLANAFGAVLSAVGLSAGDSPRRASFGLHKATTDCTDDTDGGSGECSGACVKHRGTTVRRLIQTPLQHSCPLVFIRGLRVSRAGSRRCGALGLAETIFVVRARKVRRRETQRPAPAAFAKATACRGDGRAPQSGHPVATALWHVTDKRRAAPWLQHICVIRESS